MIKLEIGGGTRPKKDYINMDIIPFKNVDIVWDATVTPYPIVKDTYDEIYSHWFLEHISFRDIKYVLKEWYRILKTDGIVNATTNNYEAHNKALAEGVINWEEWNRMIFGINTEEDYLQKGIIVHNKPINVFECHKMAWNKQLVNKLFTEAGFKNITVNETWKHREDNGELKCPGLIIKAVK